jgi:hypothetical protein
VQEIIAVTTVNEVLYYFLVEMDDMVMEVMTGFGKKRKIA